MPLAVRHGDETAAGAKHARELAEAAIDVGEVEEHPRRDHTVERPVLEREARSVSHQGLYATTSGELDHPR